MTLLSLKVEKFGSWMKVECRYCPSTKYAPMGVKVAGHQRPLSKFSNSRFDMSGETDSHFINLMHNKGEAYNERDGFWYQ